MMNMQNKYSGKPPKIADLQPFEKAVVHHVMLQLGLVPIESMNVDMRRPLRTIPVDEARVMKRKFRKYWRKVMRSLYYPITIPGKIPRGQRFHTNDIKDRMRTIRSWNDQLLGAGQKIPNVAQRRARKIIVFNHIWEKFVAPMLVNIANPQDNHDEIKIDLSPLT